MKPIIGIISKMITSKVGGGEQYTATWQLCSFNSHLRYALIKNGAWVMGILPQHDSLACNEWDKSTPIIMTEDCKQGIKYFIDQCDGIVLQGGINSDIYELFVGKYCFENDIPLLGICAGQNEILRSLGGSAKRHNIPDRHNRPDLEYAHSIKIIKDTKFYNIVKCDTMQVNSIHNYTPDDTLDFTISAYSDDGQVEVYEHPDKRFCMGIRFHPELLVDKDPKMNAIIKEFVQACKPQK